jgi:hypothetical protein
LFRKGAGELRINLLGRQVSAEMNDAGQIFVRFSTKTTVLIGRSFAPHSAKTLPLDRGPGEAGLFVVA